VDPVQVAGAVAALAGGVAGVGYLGRSAWRLSGRVHRLADDLLGDRAEGRPGVSARLDQVADQVAGMDRRLAAVEQQVSPNGGKSLHDKVEAVREAVVRET
jgi:hypothetical protein